MSVESQATEVSIYVGNSITAILYGIELCVTFSSIYLLISNRRTKEEARKNNLLIVYSIILFILITIAFSTNVVMGQLMWIEHRNYPGGPYAYFLATENFWVETFGTSTAVVANIMSDALLVYRCYIIWSRSNWVLIPLMLLYLSSIAFSLLTTLQSALINNAFLAGSTNFYIPWISLTTGLNFIVSGLIVYRILSYSYMARKSGMPPESLRIYTSAAAIIIESALPFSILGIVFAVYSVDNKPPSEALAFIWGLFFGLSPQLMILRVAMGRAWTEHTKKNLALTTLQFRRNEPKGSETLLYSSNGQAATTTAFESAKDQSTTAVLVPDTADSVSSMQCV